MDMEELTIAADCPSSVESTKTHLAPENMPLVDYDAFDQICSQIGDRSFVESLIVLFENHGRKSIQELSAILSTADTEGLSHVSHRWRGSALNIGLCRLAAELQQFEMPQKTKSELIEAAQIKLPLLAKLFEQSCEALRYQILQGSTLN